MVAEGIETAEDAAALAPSAWTTGRAGTSAGPGRPEDLPAYLRPMSAPSPQTALAPVTGSELTGHGGPAALLSGTNGTSKETVTRAPHGT